MYVYGSAASSITEQFFRSLFLSCSHRQTDRQTDRHKTKLRLFPLERIEFFKDQRILRIHTISNILDQLLHFLFHTRKSIEKMAWPNIRVSWKSFSLKIWWYLPCHAAFSLSHYILMCFFLLLSKILGFRLQICT
jgi:hypothetical protein